MNKDDLKAIGYITIMYAILMALAHIICHVLFKIPMSQYLFFMTYVLWVFGIFFGGAVILHKKRSEEALNKRK